MLPIFPEGGLTSSVITTVWVGVFVLAFFNLRFGWVLSGLVVPGYVVPLLILRPVAAGVIVVEAIITYLIVYWFSERLARGRFNALFGRDRFMGLVLASIAVRATFDGWLLPLAAQWLDLHAGLQLDWHSNLQSFGLVVISLMANQFWKPGLARGLFSAAVVTGITFLIVRYGLMEFTNFRLSGVSYVYEGLASSILASPKAYIILVLTAFIASQMNVRYGWDFSGILIPALIALQWYQPAKVLSSFIEAGVIYFLARALIRLPYFAAMTIEGARKLVIFFNVSFVYKLLLGHGLNLLDLDVKTTDFYGFGYLLSTLLAIKAYDKDIFPRVMRSTLEVSLAGAAAGNLIGFVLALVLPASQSAAAARLPGTRPGQGGELAASAAGSAYLSRGGLAQAPPASGEIRALEDAVELLEQGALPQFVAPGLVQAGFAVRQLGAGSLAISRRTGGDLLVFAPAARSPLAVTVPDTAARPGLAAAGLALFRQQRARWLVLASPSGAVPGDPGSMLAALRRVARAPELELSAAGPATRRLELSGAAASALDLGALQTLLPGLATVLASGSAGSHARLALGEAELAAIARTDLPAAEPAIGDCAIVAAKPDETAPPVLSSLAFLRFEVAEPLISALERRAPLPEVARRNAALAGWSLDKCLLQGREHWRLTQPGGSEGTFLFAPQGDRSKLIESEASLARPLAAAGLLHTAWNSGALLLAPDDERLAGAQRSGFGVISQALLRARPAYGTRLIQVRAAAASMPGLAGEQSAVLLDLIEPDRTWRAELDRLAASTGQRPVGVEGSKATAGLEVAVNYSVRYFAETGRGRHATIWLLRPVADRGGPIR